MSKNKIFEEDFLNEINNNDLKEILNKEIDELFGKESLDNLEILTQLSYINRYIITYAIKEENLNNINTYLQNMLDCLNKNNIQEKLKKNKFDLLQNSLQISIFLTSIYSSFKSWFSGLLNNYSAIVYESNTYDKDLLNINDEYISEISNFLKTIPAGGNYSSFLKEDGSNDI